CSASRSVVLVRSARRCCSSSSAPVPPWRSRRTHRFWCLVRSVWKVGPANSSIAGFRGTVFGSGDESQLSVRLGGEQGMKLLMFRDGAAPRLGVSRDGAADEIVDVAAAANGSSPETILDVIDAGEDGLDRLRVLASSAPASAIRNLADLTLLPPFDPPRGDVLAIGRNYQKHAEETARATNVAVGPPTIFTKAITTISAPYADIRIDPSVSTKI